MGGDEETVTTEETTQTVTPEVLPQQQELLDLQLQLFKSLQPGAITAGTAAQDLISQILSGQPLTGTFAPLTTGITPETAQGIAGRAVDVVQPRFAQSGLLDSGVNAAISSEIASDILLGAEQFNIGLAQNLLTTGLGGQATTGQFIGQTGFGLNQAFAGLTPVSTTGTSRQTQIAPGQNPFLTSFLPAIGTGLGFALGGPLGAALGGAAGSAFQPQ